MLSNTMLLEGISSFLMQVQEKGKKHLSPSVWSSVQQYSRSLELAHLTTKKIESVPIPSGTLNSGFSPNFQTEKNFHEKEKN